jgi:predicted AlkP superfamily pyrophosphatase or phosphodiesterase
VPGLPLQRQQDGQAYLTCQKPSGSGGRWKLSSCIWPVAQPWAGLSANSQLTRLNNKMKKPGVCRVFFVTLHKVILPGHIMPTALRIPVLLMLFFCSHTLATDHEGGRNFPLGTGGVNAPYQLTKPYLIMISVDGFRWDYLNKYPSPAMNLLAKNGVRSERLLPVFPTLTFPNHYSLVTGLYPANHGITSNDFPLDDEGNWYHIRSRDEVENGSNYRGEPLWVTAETQGMVAAAFFWVGSEADIGGLYATHWRTYDKKVEGNDRVDQVLEWLAKPEASRPHLYTMYFEDVDDNSHWYGPETPENAEAVLRVDGYISRLLEGIAKLPHADQVNIVLVSDHGQATYIEDQEFQVLDQLVSLNGMEIVDGGSYMHLHFDKQDRARAVQIRDAVNTSWSHAQAYLIEDTPDEWHINDDPRFPDVIIEGESGYGVFSNQEETTKMHPGDHGWRPEDEDMHGFFVASGPAFKQGLSIGPVKNVDIQALVLSVLSLQSPGNTDSDPQALTGILKNP